MVLRSRGHGVPWRQMIGLVIGGVFAAVVAAIVGVIFVRLARNEEKDRKR